MKFAKSVNGPHRMAAYKPQYGNDAIVVASVHEVLISRCSFIVYETSGSFVVVFLYWVPTQAATTIAKTINQATRKPPIYPKQHPAHYI